MDVGVKELRDGLSRYLDAVRHGESVVVTDRGRAVARLVPVDGGRPLDRLVEAGLVTRASGPRPRAPRLAGGDRVSELVADQRR